MNMIDIKPLEQEVESILYENQTILVNTRDEYEQAGDTIKLLSTKIKKLEEKRKEYTKPLDESKKRIMADFKKMIDPLDELIGQIKGAMMTWQKMEQKRLQEEQARIDAEALAKAKEDKQSVVEVSDITQTAKTIRGEISTASVRKIWKWRIVDETQVPREYLSIDSQKLNQAVRDGHRKIDGIEIYEDEQVIIR